MIPKYVQQRTLSGLMAVSLFLGFLTVAIALYRGGVNIGTLEAQELRLAELPMALGLSTARMFVAYMGAVIFSFLVGLLAARSWLGERLILPILDVLQSVPIVGFFPAAISFFVGLTQGSRLGVELAAVFLIFTSQAWNMAFSVYESIKALPSDQLDAVTSFGVKGSRRLWKLYIPICIPRMVFNSILSWSNGWFFLVACEIIAVGPIKYHLPGIGSFLARAAETDDIPKILYGLTALSTLILSIDFFVWRPLSAWSDKYKYEQAQGDDPSPDFSSSFLEKLSTKLDFVRRLLSTIVRTVLFPMVWFAREVVLPLIWDLPVAILHAIFFDVYGRLTEPLMRKWDVLSLRFRWLSAFASALTFVFVIALTLLLIGRWLSPPWPPIIHEIPGAILVSTGRIFVTLLVSLAWIIPLVLWTWDKPAIRRTLTTIAQVGASVPAIALFPLFILVLAQRVGGGMEFASILLLLAGMQWYLLFNVLGGVATIPGDLVETVKAFGLERTGVWKKLVIPSIRPAAVTGAITAWGGGWNALVVAEYVRFKGEILSVQGIGALLNRAVFELGDGKAIATCIAAMVAWILVLNFLIWQPLYRNTISKYKMDY